MMRRAIILLIVGAITLSVVFIIYRPDLIEKFWLWIVGLIGPIVAGIKRIVAKITDLFKPNRT